MHVTRFAKKGVSVHQESIELSLEHVTTLKVKSEVFYMYVFVFM